MSLGEGYLLATVLYLLLFRGVFSEPTCFFNKDDELNNMLFLSRIGRWLCIYSEARCNSITAMS